MTVVHGVLSHRKLVHGVLRHQKLVQGGKQRTAGHVVVVVGIGAGCTVPAGV